MSERIERKPVEKVKGKVKIFEGEQLLKEASHKLTRYQNIHHSQTFGPNDNADEGFGVIESFINADVSDINGKLVTLELEDGRRVDGKISAAGGGTLGFFITESGFYRP